MKNITLLTTSEKKKKSFKKVLSKYDIGVEISDIWIPEIQSDNNIDVAKFAAQFGANLLGKPVVKMDSGFFVEGLNGFPGPFVKYVSEKIGAEIFFKMLDSVENKKARISSALAFCEPSEEPVVFEGGCSGRIVDKIKSGDGFIDKLFIPSHPQNKKNLTIGEIRNKNYDQFLEIWGNTEEQFAKWYIKR